MYNSNKLVESRSMNTKLERACVAIFVVAGTIGLSLVSFGSIAAAKTIDFQPQTTVFKNGATVVPSGVLQACVGDVVHYKTRSVKDLRGAFWVKTHTDKNCTGNGGKMTGYFEERSADGQQFCTGQMTMEFNGRGFHHIVWNSIKPAPKSQCAGAGQTFELFLSRV
jgi:hypothetical protein